MCSIRSGNRIARNSRKTENTPVKEISENFLKNIILDLKIKKFKTNRKRTIQRRVSLQLVRVPVCQVIIALSKMRRKF